MLAGLRFGDWKNIREYYPTILFLIIGDLLYNLFTYNDPMWSYSKDWFLPNHILVNLWIMATVYPATVIIYLSHFPKTISKRILFILFWALLYVLIEMIGLHLFGLINHFNGWNMWWSMLMDLILFVMLYIHYKRPLIAWGLSIVIIIFFLKVFNVNVFLLN